MTFFLLVFRYKLCLNTRSGAKVSQDCTGAISAMTSPDVPSAPTITEVKQVKDMVQIIWTAPSQPNGVLVKYIISLHPVKDDGSVDESAGRVRVWSTESADLVNFLVLALRPYRSSGYDMNSFKMVNGSIRKCIILESCSIQVVLVALDRK